MIFSKFTKPKWQHRNPVIRQSAVENLDDFSILNEIAQHDEVAEVRQTAIKKINDLSLLEHIIQHDTDSRVRKLAEQRFKQLFCFQKDDGLSLKTRLTWLDKITDAELLAHIALQGPEIELRLAALEKVKRESLLGDIAINDPISVIRFAAIKKLTQKSILERVIKATRNNDKRVSRKAREKLDQVIEKMERPKRVRTECEAICTRLESLEHRLNTKSHNPLSLLKFELKRLQERWQAIAADVEIDCQTRFEKAQQAAESAFEDYQQAQAREESRMPLRTAKQTLYEQMEALWIDLKKYQHLDDKDNDIFTQKFNLLQNKWSEIKTLDDSDEELKWQTQFNKVSKSVQKRQQKLQTYHQKATRLESLCTQTETLLAIHSAMKPKHLKDLQAQWKAISQPEDDQTLPLFTALNNRFESNLKGLNTRHQEQKEECAKALDDIKQHLQNLETALEQGQLKTAVPLEQQIRDGFKSLEDLAITQQAKTLERRLQKCSIKINELRSWQHWGNKLERENLCQQVENSLENENDNFSDLILLTEKAQTAWKQLGAGGYSRELWERFNHVCQTVYQRYREHLCQQMENSLEKTENDLEERAKSIRQAQTTWKKLGSQGHSQALWERFNKACEVAYKPCRTHFNIKANERQQSFLEKQAICEYLETFAAETNWKEVDWKKVYHFVRDMDKKWRNIGPTNRKVKKAIQHRFQTALHVLETYLDEERQANCRFRLYLMHQVEKEANDLQVFIEAKKKYPR